MTKISNQYSLTNILTADLANSRVGVNNASPSYSLDVTGTARVSGSVYLATASGNVGINTTSTNAQLHIVGNSTSELTSGVKLVRSEQAGQYIVMNYESGIANFTAVDTAFSGPQFRFNTSTNGTTSTEVMRILSSGNIGIGMTTSQYNRVSIKSNSATAYAGLAVYSPTIPNYIYVNHNATVGIIGTDSTGVAGTAHTPILIYCGNDERMRFSTNGNIGAGGGTTNIYNASDIRLKKNIIPITLGLNAISALNPVKFNWADGFDEIEADKTLLGFIAQEVQEVIPEAVETFGGNSLILGDTTIDNPLRVNEKFIIPVLVKAIQELSAKVTLLENK